MGKLDDMPAVAFVPYVAAPVIAALVASIARRRQWRYVPALGLALLGAAAVLLVCEVLAVRSLRL